MGGGAWYMFIDRVCVCVNLVKQNGFATKERCIRMCGERRIDGCHIRYIHFSTCRDPARAVYTAVLSDRRTFLRGMCKSLPVILCHAAAGGNTDVESVKGSP